MKQVKCLLEGKSEVCVNRHMGGLKERVMPLVTWITSSEFPLANHLLAWL